MRRTLQVLLACGKAPPFDAWTRSSLAAIRCAKQAGACLRLDAPDTCERVTNVGRRPALAVCGVLLLVLAWVLYTAAVCRSDGDCWLGERVRMVSESALSPHYDPGEANQRILIYDFAGVRSLKFGSLTHVRQATAVVGDSNKFTMPISCHMAAAVLVLCPLPPKRILIFGMGGGMLPAYVQVCVNVCV